MRLHSSLALACLLGLALGCAGEPVARAPAAPPMIAKPGAAPVAAAAAPDPSAAAEAPAPRGPVDELRDGVLATSKAWATVQQLTDRAGPRLSGSIGHKLAVDWALEYLKAAGFANVRAEPVTVPHWERGGESGQVVAPRSHRLAIAALGGSVGTPARGLEAEVVEAGSIEALDALAPDKVKGKIVFFNKKTERMRSGEGYGHAVDVRGVGAIHAAKLGAVGVIIRSVGTDEDRLPHTGNMRYEDKTTKIPAAAVSVPDAELIHRLLATGPVRVQMSLGARTLPDAPSANVVADVPGSAAPEEIVLLGAHLDSWDLGSGALDDGAGCAIVIEAARQIAALARHPRRTVRVVLFANEENGLAGAKAYAKAHEAELPKHVVALESDFGAAAPYEIRFLGPDAARPAFLKLARTVAPLGVLVSSVEAEGGADLGPLRAAGVPLVDLHQDGTLYFDIHHSANDTLEKVDRQGLEKTSAAYAALAYAVADAPGDLGRVPDDKRVSKR